MRQRPSLASFQRRGVGNHAGVSSVAEFGNAGWTRPARFFAVRVSATHQRSMCVSVSHREFARRGTTGGEKSSRRGASGRRPAARCAPPLFSDAIVRASTNRYCADPEAAAKTRRRAMRTVSDRASPRAFSSRRAFRLHRDEAANRSRTFCAPRTHAPSIAPRSYCRIPRAESGGRSLPIEHVML